MESFIKRMRGCDVRMLGIGDVRDLIAGLGITGDVASFYNLSTDEAYTKLKSIWTGETETLKDLGVVMTQTNLDQYALNNGFGKTTAKMTEQEKVMLQQPNLSVYPHQMWKRSHSSSF